MFHVEHIVMTKLCIHLSDLTKRSYIRQNASFRFFFRKTDETDCKKGRQDWSQRAFVGTMRPGPAETYKTDTGMRSPDHPA